ncbi:MULTISPECIES: transcriptional regulator [Rhodococcus]|uniref:transcriptional regulator n=1 Tax=Rhodococcus TaxID=1827 RepID=UPI001E40F9CA|nr:transcriptional regulator [Rhodococcus pyridinivorans]MCD2118395.1 transcriptional regulator [Rhodococcus pyridinivorans]MCZ4627177.1 transcriptional regulator [Rhodococcus pyridinivorans]MCZ4648467.1 transcriptional regulator [Rhodococcus pyridinivorans]MDJ0481099.1 transcriptional regulator [Rhodococcus pyridinivorans]MDV7254565.1 transcriptional regulator [Rhodococcus pyridinivorans]
MAQTDFKSIATGGDDRFKLADLPQTRSQATSSIGRLVDATDQNYRNWAGLGQSIQNSRRDVLLLDLDQRAKAHAKESPRDTLEDLADLGFSWRSVAAVLGVSVPAVNKWRRGEGISGENRLKIAKLRAMVDILEVCFIKEPVSWLEMPIQERVALSRMDLLVGGRYDLVIELARSETGSVGATAEDVLNEFNPRWRTELVDDHFETFIDADGDVGIRPRGQ